MCKPCAWRLCGSKSGHHECGDICEESKRLFRLLHWWRSISAMVIRMGIRNNIFQRSIYIIYEQSYFPRDGVFGYPSFVSNLTCWTLVFIMRVFTLLISSLAITNCYSHDPPFSYQSQIRQSKLWKSQYRSSTWTMGHFQVFLFQPTLRPWNASLCLREGRFGTVWYVIRLLLFYESLILLLCLTQDWSTGVISIHSSILLLLLLLIKSYGVVCATHRLPHSTLGIHMPVA